MAISKDCSFLPPPRILTRGGLYIFLFVSFFLILSFGFVFVASTNAQSVYSSTGANVPDGWHDSSSWSPSVTPESVSNANFVIGDGLKTYTKNNVTSDSFPSTNKLYVGYTYNDGALNPSDGYLCLRGVSNGAVSITIDQLFLGNGSINQEATRSAVTLDGCITVEGNGTILVSTYSPLSDDNRSLTFTGELKGTGNLLLKTENHNKANHFASLTIASSANEFTGAVTTDAGSVITLSGANALHKASSFTNNGSLTLSANQTLNNLSGSGTVDFGAQALTLSNSENSEFSGTLQGSGTLTKTGAGTLTFSANTRQGSDISAFIINQGKVIINPSEEQSGWAAYPTGLWGTTPITVNSGAALEYGVNSKHAATTNTKLTINNGYLNMLTDEYFNNLDLNCATVTVASGKYMRVGYHAAGVWNVIGNGTTTITGSIQTADKKDFTINVADSATLDIVTNISGISSNTGANVIFNGSGENGTGMVNLHLSGTDSAPKRMSGLGTIQFNNVNATLDGSVGWLAKGYFVDSPVKLTDSTLTISSNHSTNGTVFTLDNSSLLFNGNVGTYLNQVTLKNGSTIGGTNNNSEFRTGYEWNTLFTTQNVDGDDAIMNTISANVAMYDKTKTLTFDIADKAPLTVSGVICMSDLSTNTGCNPVIKNGDGVLIFSAANTYDSTTTINAGTLKLTGAGTLGTGAVTVGENATLEIAYDNPNTSVNISSISMADGDVFNEGSAFKVPSGAVTFGTENVALNNLSGGSLGANGQIAVPATLTVTGKLTLNNDQLTKFIGSITAPTVEKTGLDTLQLCFDAQNAVSIGSLVVSSGRVDLKGYMQGGITVDANGIFSPGNSVGEAKFGGGYELYDGAKLLIEMDETGIDSLIASSFTENNGIIELVIDGIPFGSQYDVITATNGFSGSQDEAYWLGKFGTLPDYMTLSVVDGVYGANSQTVRLSIDRNAVPEPSTWALLLLGAAGLMYVRKQTRK